jgi:hypothetical protein
MKNRNLGILIVTYNNKNTLELKMELEGTPDIPETMDNA